MKTSATNRKIRVLLTAIRESKLIPRPEFQRRLVWTNKHKQEFIQTVLLKYPFPEIYIAAGEVNPDTGEGIEMLVDGQQRITTLNQYFVGSSDLRLGELRPYASLSPEEKLDFLEYEVVIRDIGKKSIEEIKEVFRRINSTKYSLNAMETHNARYDGAFKQFVEKLSQHAFFEKHSTFKANEVRRMGDMNYTAVLAVTLMSTYFNRDSEIEQFMEMYNDEFADAEILEEGIEKVFEFVESLKLTENSRLWKKTDLFTALVELYRCIIMEGYVLDRDKVGRDLERFYSEVDEYAKTSVGHSDIANYHKATIQASNDRSSRVTRGKVFRNAVFSSVVGYELD
jgi:hypothetical protein